MTDDWGPEEWAAAWQSAPAHLRGGSSRGSAAVCDDQADAGLSDGGFSDAASFEESGRLSDLPPGPAPKPKLKPIWHAVPVRRAEPRATDGELQELGSRIRGMAADLAASTCEWLRLIERFDRRRGWVGVGIASCAAWLSWTCSISPATAREYLRVARSLPLLPLITAAFAAGELSYSKVRILVTVAADVDESTLLQQARIQTVSQMERTIRALRRGDGWDQQRSRRATWRWDEDGMLVISARLPADEGALLVAALERSRADGERASGNAPKTPDGGSPEDASSIVDDEDRRRAALTRADPLDVARADMLVALAEQALAAGPADSSGDDRHLVVVHADLDQLGDGRRSGERHGDGQGPGEARVGEPPAEQGRVSGPRCYVENGPGLDRRVARRIACDAALIAVIHHVGEGEPLRLGRKTRTIAPAQRRALRIRDEGCQFPGCHRRTHLNAHHVRPWSLFGPTDLDNLVLLCRFHHMLVHEGGFTVAAGGAAGSVLAGDPVGTPSIGTASRWIFRDPDGEPVSVGPPPATRNGDDAVRRLPAQGADPAGLLPEWRGEPFHLADAVGALACAPRRAALVGAGAA